MNTSGLVEVIRPEMNLLLTFTYEPRREKTGFLHMRKQIGADQFRGHREADQCLCFRYTDSTIPLLP